MPTDEYLWRDPPADLALMKNEIHVWRANLNLPALRIQALAQNLSHDEQRRAERFYFARDKKHFAACRGLLRLILGRYLRQPPSQLQFSYHPHGKPALAQKPLRVSSGIEPVRYSPVRYFIGSLELMLQSFISRGRNSAVRQTLISRVEGTIRFNVSHSNGLALLAFARDRSVGVDLEYIRPVDVEQLAKRFFSSREYAALSSLNPEQKHEAFFNGWTRKEAYLKATGIGIAGLKQVEVSITSGEPAAFLSIAGDAPAASDWSLHRLSPAPGYVAAVAAEGRGWQLSCFTASHESFQTDGLHRKMKE
jgi:4'-phosphopantetheinyl transferase